MHKQSEEKLSATSGTHTEWLVLDRAGRLQLPQEYVDKLKIKIRENACEDGRREKFTSKKARRNPGNLPKTRRRANRLRLPMQNSNAGLPCGVFTPLQASPE